MDVLFGFDPGGDDGFGWSVLRFAPDLPLPVLATGIVDNAREAVDAARASLPEGAGVAGCGIDAPLYWISDRARRADEHLRHRLSAAGAPSPGGTVQAPNSLRGACLIQGVLTAVLLRRVWPDVIISESHPKAMLWLMGVAKLGTHHNSVGLGQLPHLVRPHRLGVSDHERDAALSALSAWAAVTSPPSWRNLLLDEVDTFSPIVAPLAYWMPRAGAARTATTTNDSKLDGASLPTPLSFHSGGLVGGGWTRSSCPEWDWTRDGGGYGTGRDFFSVHWEVQHRDPQVVRLHVEAPRHNEDTALNVIKQELLAALLASDPEALLMNSGHSYRAGSKASVVAVQKNKSTEAFRVLLASNAPPLTHKERIQAVHDVLGARINAVVVGFSPRLDVLFGAGRCAAPVEASP